MGLVRGPVRSDSRSALGRLIESAHDPQKSECSQSALTLSLFVARRNISAPHRTGNAEAGLHRTEIDHRDCLPAFRIPGDRCVARTTTPRPAEATLPRPAKSTLRPTAHPPPAIKPSTMSIVVRRNVIPQPVIGVSSGSARLPIPLIVRLGGQFTPEDFINCIRITTPFHRHNNPQTMMKITNSTVTRVHPHLTKMSPEGLREPRITNPGALSEFEAGELADHLDGKRVQGGHPVPYR